MKLILIPAMLLLVAIGAAQSRVDDMKAGYDREMDLIIDRYFHDGRHVRVELGEPRAELGAGGGPQHLWRAVVQRHRHFNSAARENIQDR